MIVTSSELKRCLGLDVSSYLFALQYLLKAELMIQGVKSTLEEEYILG